MEPCCGSAENICGKQGGDMQVPEHMCTRDTVAPSLGCQVAKILGPSSSALGAFHMVLYLEEGKRTGTSSGHCCQLELGLSWGAGCWDSPHLRLVAVSTHGSFGDGLGCTSASSRPRPCWQLLADDGCVLLPAPAGPSLGTWTGGHWEGQVEEKGSAGLMNHPFHLLCPLSLPFAPLLSTLCLHLMQGLCWARLKYGRCACAGLSCLDPAAVAAVEVAWDPFLLHLPWAGTAQGCLSPPPECWDGSVQGK